MARQEDAPRRATAQGIDEASLRGHSCAAMAAWRWLANGHVAPATGRAAGPCASWRWRPCPHRASSLHAGMPLQRGAPGLPPLSCSRRRRPRMPRGSGDTSRHGSCHEARSAHREVATEVKEAATATATEVAGAEPTDSPAGPTAEAAMAEAAVGVEVVATERASTEAEEGCAARRQGSWVEAAAAEGHGAKRRAPEPRPPPHPCRAARRS